MKKYIFLILSIICCISCSSSYDTIEQKGIIVDVTYHSPSQAITNVPIRVGKTVTYSPRVIRHSEYWDAHIHYNDTICVNEHIYHKVEKGDTISRTIMIKHKKNK